LGKEKAKKLTEAIENLIKEKALNSKTELKDTSGTVSKDSKR
jgi:hypothetical protein